MQIIMNEQVAQSVIEVLSDKYARKIIFATTATARSTEEVSIETKIPISTCYRRIHSMVKFGLLVVDRTILTDDGRKYETYKSAIKDARVKMEAGKVTVEATLNTDSAGRLYNNWMKMKDTVGEQKFAEASLNDQGIETLNVEELIPKSLNAVLRDCDVCHDQYVLCRTYNERSAGVEKFVCLQCENKRKPLVKEAVFSSSSSSKLPTLSV